MLISTSLLIGLIFLPSKNPPSGFWAFFFFDQYPWWVRLLWALGPALLTLCVARPLIKKLSGPASQLRGVRLFISLALLCVLSFCLFWALRERRFWGDAEATIKILEGTAPDKPLGVFFWKEPLDRLLAVLFYETFHAVWDWGAADSTALMSCLAGSVFVALLYVLAREVGSNRFSQFFIFAFTVGMGASQLFFGHVENYTVATLCMLIFTLTGVRFLKDKGPLWGAGLSAAVAVSVHPLAAFLFPTLALLPILKEPGLRWKNIHSSLLAMIPGLVYLVAFHVLCRALGAPELVIGANRYGGARIFIPFAQVLRAEHLWDVFQGYLLTLPLGIFLFRLKLGWVRDRVALFLAVSALSFFVYALFFDARLKRLMDWDLFAPAALPATLWVAYSGAAAGQESNLRKVSAFYVVLFSFSFTIPWILSNHLQHELDVEWGQDLIQLRRYLQTHDIDQVYLSYSGDVDPARYGFRYTPLPSHFSVEETSGFTPFVPPPGFYALSVTNLSGQSLDNPSLLDWFNHQAPIANISHSINVYQVLPADPPLTWVARCITPTLPLDDAVTVAGFGRADLRRTDFDCSSAWIYPGDGAGVYALHRDLLQQRNSRSDPVPIDHLIARHVAGARLSYVQERTALTPPFVLYEHPSSSPPPSPLSPVWTAPADTSLAALTNAPPLSGPVRLDGPLIFVGMAAYPEGNSLEVETWWQVTTGPITRPLSIMAHLLTPNGEALSVADGLGVSPLALAVGDLVVQRHRFPTPLQAELWLRTGAYWLDTMERWPVGDVPGDDALFIPLETE